ncbi:MAG: quinol:electron acceptor oxidoreductase subunit ActD [Planctomycetota bacterium]
MSETKKTVHGIMAEFTSVDSLLSACRRIRDAGYTKTDAFTPFPVHGIDKALGIKPTKLPWIALVGGVSGTLIALTMQIWMNGIDYKYIISGKPYISLPAFMPVAFELTILLASFGAFFGMWALNGLPRFSNPMFTDPRFDRATDDRFFLYIDARDARYDSEGVRKLFADTGSEYINEVIEDDTPTKIPKPIFMVWGTMVAASVIPLLVVLTMRVTNSSQPRFHVFPDMDFSPAKDAQMSTSLFVDNRSMRPDVPGTVARGQMEESLDVLTGIDSEKLAQIDAPRADRLVRAYFFDDEVAKAEEVAEVTEAEGEAAAPSVMDTTPWVKEIPIKVDAALIEKGQQQFGIYCSVCHGLNGRGNGLVNQRAQSINSPTWVPPSNMHQDSLYSDKYPDGKLYSTITNGIRKMPGYAGQIKLRDRWAIVAYVRALQKSQNASIDLVPPSQKAAVEKAVADAKAELERQAAEAEKAEAERKAKEEKEKAEAAAKDAPAE